LPAFFVIAFCTIFSAANFHKKTTATWCKTYGYGLFCFALAMLCLGWAAYPTRDQPAGTWIIASFGFTVVASLFMLATALYKVKQLVRLGLMAIATLYGVTLIAFRYFFAPPATFTALGGIMFNLPPLLLLAVSLLVVLTLLPASLKISRQLKNKNSSSVFLLANILIVAGAVLIGLKQEAYIFIGAWLGAGAALLLLLVSLGLFEAEPYHHHE